MSQSLNIDFIGRRASPPYFKLGLLVLALAGAAYTGSQLAHEWAAVQRQEALISRIAIAQKPARRAPPTAANVERQRQYEAVRRELAVPWETLLSIIETSPVPGIALIGIDQSPAQAQIHFTAEAKDLGSMADYVAYLQSDPRLKEAVLLNHQIEASEPGTPVRFQIAAVWRQS